MDRKYNIQLNLSPYANYFLDGGNTGGMTYTPEDNGFIRGSFSTDWTPQGISPNDAVLSDYQQKMVNRADMKQAIAEKGKGFSDKMNSSGGGGWANAIAPAATNIANAFLDTEASTADRVAGALGIPALANQWRADTSKGDSYLKGMTSTLDSMSGKNYIQDASSTFGANNTVKLNNKQIISPISPASALPSLKDFKGNWWRNMGASVVQGAASGSVGGPWGAAGGALTGLFGSLGGLFGRKKRAEKAYEDFLHKRDTLMSAQQNAFNTAVKNQTLSNMQALANGNMSQRINDMANIRAYGGNLFDGGGDLTDEQQMVLADIQADPRILFTPKYSQWRDYIRRTSPDYLDRLYTSLPYEQQQDIYQNDREAWGALSNKTKGDFGGAQVRKKTDEVSPYVAGALGLVGAAPAMEAVAMFPMLENGLNAYFGYEGVKNLPTAVADTYNYAKEGDWSRAGLSAGEAALDGMFIGNGIKGIKGISNVVKPKNVMNMPSNGNYIPSRNYFYSQIDNPSVAKYIAEVEGNPAFQTRPFSKFSSEDETLSYLRHNSLGRTRKYGTDSFYPEQIDEFDKAFNNYMKDYDYQTFNSQKWEKAGKEDLAGFHDPENKYIAAVEDSKIPLKDIMRHEVRHAYDNYEDILSNKQHDILDNAYGSDFVDLPKKVAGNDPLKNYSNMGLEKTTTNLDARKALLKGREESASIEVQNMIIDKMTDEKIIEAVRNSNGYGRRYIEYLEENNLLTPQKVQAFRDAMKYVGIGIGVGLISNNNNIEYAMGGNLYTDLSPNMMNLWNNKQQIDQQKAMNQQFSLGLGNSSFVNKFETGGPVDPPKEFMDVYHPDWGIYTPDYANMTFDEYKQKYGNPNDPDNFDYSPESYNSYQYRLYQPYPNSSTFGNSYLFRPEMSVLNKKYPIENLPVYRDKKGDLYLKRGIKDLYGNNDVYIEGNTEDPTYNRRNENGDLRITPHKDEWESGHSNSDKSVPRERFEDFKKSSEEQVLNELRRRAYDNEFYSYPEVQKYNANNSKQKSSNATTKKTANATAVKSSSEKKASSKAATKSANNIDNMTYQQMEDYYGQKQSPLLNTQYKNTWATGGQMTSLDVPDNMQYFANGGTHEENPYGGIQVGTDQQGTPNLVEEGEFRWNNFVFSDRINVDANLLSSFNLAPATKHQNKKAAKGKLSYADMAKKYAKRNKELENDPITKNSMEAFMQRLANAQEYQKKAEQLEAQKQNELQDYKTALNKQNNNPMYGTMKYNGMGNDATQQGVNSGVDAGIGNPMSNADLSNVNRSGNEMMAAYGGNLFAIGGKDDPNPYEWTLDNLNARQVLTPWNGNFIGPTLGDNTNLGITPSADNYSWGNINANTPFYQNEGWGIDMKPTYMKVKNPNYNAPAVSTYASRDKNGKIVYDPSGKPFMSYPRTYEGMKSSDYPNTKVIGKTVDNNGFYLNVPQYTPPAQGKVIQPEYEPDLSDYKTAYYKDFNPYNIDTTPEISDNPMFMRDSPYAFIPFSLPPVTMKGVPQTDNIGTADTQSATGSVDASDKVIDKTTSNTNPDAAVPSDPKEAPLYSTAGKYAQFGKGIMPMIWDWANKTNVKYDPYQRDADRLEALANEGPALRTADTIGGYRAPNLMDVERLNNSARAEGLAQMQAILDAANGNRGFVGAQSAQNNYNTQKGIGDNYIKAQEANNAERLQTDQFNHGINVANQNAINAMYQDNQRAEQAQHQAALSGTAQAAALRQGENFHADEVNTERMKNRAANQAAYVDNALNYFTTQAMENQELNTRNNDPTNPYWIDKNGVTHYTGDSGLNQAIHDAFGNDEYGRNGTFTGDRLTEWNNLTKKYKAKDLKEHPELWRHLVAQQREANKIDADKAKQAKLEELEALRGTYQSNLARLNALRDSGAIISDPSYNLYTGWADEDYSGNQGLLRNRNQALDQYITQIGNNYDRYLYEKQLAQNQAKALGGYLDDRQNNNNYYYSYTRI